MVINNSALIILSGGQDSTTTLFWAKRYFGGDMHAITFDYGQRHRMEIDAARTVAQLAGVKTHEVIDVQGCLHSASPLTSNTELEKYDNYEQMEKVIGDRIELTFVPMRNMFFFTVAMNRAVKLGIKNLVTGICQQDNANYPDCTDAFRQYFQDTANVSLGMKHDIYRVYAPLMHMSKAQTVLMAQEIPGCWEALAYTHTSYDGKYPPTDNNHSNVLRARGFEEAGLPDPLVVRAWREGLMAIPNTPNYRDFGTLGDLIGEPLSDKNERNA